MGPVERAGQGALRQWLRPRRSSAGLRLKLWLQRWESMVVAEVVWLTSGRRGQ
jgi:hypothetical protein